MSVLHIIGTVQHQSRTETVTVITYKYDVTCWPIDRSWFWKGATLGHLGRMERWISGSALYCCSDIASCPPIPLNIWILLQIYIQLKFMSSGVECWTLLRTLVTKIVCFQIYNTHNLGNYTEILLHQARIFYTCTACGASDKYQVCFTLGAEAAFCRSLVKMDIYWRNQTTTFGPCHICFQCGHNFEADIFNTIGKDENIALSNIRPPTKKKQRICYVSIYTSCNM